MFELCALCDGEGCSSFRVDKCVFVCVLGGVHIYIFFLKREAEGEGEGKRRGKGDGRGGGRIAGGEEDCRAVKMCA